MITLRNLSYQNTSFEKKMDKTEEKQMARKVEKFLLTLSITCEVEVK